MRAAARLSRRAAAAWPAARARGRDSDAGTLVRPPHVHLHPPEDIPLLAALERTPRRPNVPVLDRASPLAEAGLGYARNPRPRRSRRSAGVSRRAESARLGHSRPGRPYFVHDHPALSG